MMQDEAAEEIVIVDEDDDTIDRLRGKVDRMSDTVDVIMALVGLAGPEGERPDGPVWR